MTSRNETPAVFLVTTILPVFNGASFIRDALERLERSVLPVSDVILVDDGSSDETLLSLQRFQEKHPQVKLIAFERNRGVAISRNVALQLVRTRYVWFADADDIWNDDLLPVLIAAAERTGADICMCQAELSEPNSDRSSHIDGIPRDMMLTRDQALASMLRGEMHGYLWNKLFTAAILADRPFPALSSQSDFMGTLAAVSRSKRVTTIPQSLYTHVARPGSITRVKAPNLENLKRCELEMLSTLKKDWVSDESRALKDYFRTWFYLLPLVNIPIRYGATPETIRASIEASRKELRYIRLWRILRRDGATGIKAFAVLILGRFYPTFFSLVGRRKPAL